MGAAGAAAARDVEEEDPAELMLSMYTGSYLRCNVSISFYCSPDAAPVL